MGPADLSHPLTPLCKSELQTSHFIIVNELVKKSLPLALFSFLLTPCFSLECPGWPHWSLEPACSKARSRRGRVVQKRDVHLPSILGVRDTWGSRTLYLGVLVPTVRAQLQSWLCREARWDGQHGLGVHSKAAGGRETPPLPACDGRAPAHPGDWELLVWTWGTSRLWDACLKVPWRARPIVGSAPKPFSPRLVAGAVISLLQKLIAEANCLQL